MKITSYTFPKSSFLSIDKDINTIINKLLSNQNLLKLLYYTNDNPLDGETIDEDTAMDMVGGDGKQIKIVPKVVVDSSVLNYVILSFDNFTPNLTNPYYRDNVISFDIICHFEQWPLSKYAMLRPYRIAGEIDSLMNNSKLSGVGTLTFIGANQLILNDEFAGISLMYAAVHGDDDTKPDAKNPDGSDNEFPHLAEIITGNFNDMFNNSDE